jgi:hypothetical protein
MEEPLWVSKVGQCAVRIAVDAGLVMTTCGFSLGNCFGPIGLSYNLIYIKVDR